MLECWTKLKLSRDTSIGLTPDDKNTQVTNHILAQKPKCLLTNRLAINIVIVFSLLSPYPVNTLIRTSTHF